MSQPSSAASSSTETSSRIHNPISSAFPESSFLRSLAITFDHSKNIAKSRKTRRRSDSASAASEQQRSELTADPDSTWEISDDTEATKQKRITKASSAAATAASGSNTEKENETKRKRRKTGAAAQTTASAASSSSSSPSSSAPSSSARSSSAASSASALPPPADQKEEEQQEEKQPATSSPASLPQQVSSSSSSSSLSNDNIPELGEIRNIGNDQTRLRAWHDPMKWKITGCTRKIITITLQFLEFSSKKFIITENNGITADCLISTYQQHGMEKTIYLMPAEHVMNLLRLVKPTMDWKNMEIIGVPALNESNALLNGIGEQFEMLKADNLGNCSNHCIIGIRSR
jgi:hypothetical protein